MRETFSRPRSGGPNLSQHSAAELARNAAEQVLDSQRILVDRSGVHVRPRSGRIIENQSRSMAPCSTSASTSRSDTSDSIVVFPDPMEPEMISIGTVAPISNTFPYRRASSLGLTYGSQYEDVSTLDGDSI